MTTTPDTYAVERREVLGKRVARLRRDGVMPANIFGRGVDSLAVQLPARAAREMLIAHGTDSLIQLSVAGESAPRPVVVRAIQRHPVNRSVLHVDFYQVDLNRPIQASVPIHIMGEAPAVHVHQGVLLSGMDSVQVEALPADIPDNFEVSVDGLTELEMQIRASDLVLPPGVTLLTDPDVMIVRVTPPRVVAEAEEVPEGEEPEEAAEAEAEGEAAEGGAEAEESSGSD